MTEETQTLEPSQGQTETTEAIEATVQQVSTEAVEAEAQEVEGAEGEQAEEDANWLPTEQLKVFPAEVIARYAKRFGYTAEDIAADERLANALSKMINSDIHISNLKSEEQQTGEEETEGDEEPTQEAVQENPADWEARRDSFVDQITDTKVAQGVFKALNEAAAKSAQDGGVAFIKVLTSGMLNVLRPSLPALLFGANGQPGEIDRYIEQRYEGLSGTVQQTARSGAWNDLVASDPKYASLPTYDPRPSSEWHKAISRVSQMVPGFEKFTIPGASPLQTFKAKAQIAANLLSAGITANSVEAAVKAVETGKRQAKESASQKSLAKLGAGQSKASLTPKTSDPLDAEIAKFNSGQRFTQTA